jgi:hypothetical protein
MDWWDPENTIELAVTEELALPEFESAKRAMEQD